MYLKQTKLLHLSRHCCFYWQHQLPYITGSLHAQSSLHSKGKNIPFSSELPTDLQPRHIKVKDSFFSNIFELFSTSLSFKGTRSLMTVKSIYDKTCHSYFKFNYLIVSYFSSIILYEIIAEKSYTKLSFIPQDHGVILSVQIAFIGQQVQTKEPVVTPAFSNFKIRSKLSNYVFSGIIGGLVNHFYTVLVPAQRKITD